MALDQKKLKNMILYFANSPYVCNLGPTKLYKMLYFTDAASLRKLGRSMSGSEYVKYEHGPVPSRGEKVVKNLSKEKAILINQEDHYGMRLDAISATAEPDLSIFEKSELEILQQIAQTKGTASARALSDESHLEPAWFYAAMMGKLSPDLMFYGASEDPDGL